MTRRTAMRRWIFCAAQRNCIPSSAEAVGILAVGSGLRPSRVGGTRVEKEDINVAGEKRTVVHNYGAGGTGFQAGYGMATDAVEAATEVLGEIPRTEERPRL